MGIARVVQLLENVYNTTVGRVKAEVKELSASTTGTVTTSSSTVQCDCTGANAVMVFLYGTFAGVNLTFEISPDAGTTWIEAVGKCNSVYSGSVNASTTGVLAATATYTVMTNGLSLFRVRSTAYTSGTMNVVLTPTVQGVFNPPNITSTTGTLSVQARFTSSSSDGCSTYHHAVSAASTNATSVKSSKGQIAYICASNINAAIRYLKLYNKASAPTVGSDTPIMTIALPPSQTVSIPMNGTVNFSTGIAYALTTGMADSDTGAVAASEITVNMVYA